MAGSRSCKRRGVKFLLFVATYSICFVLLSTHLQTRKDINTNGDSIFSIAEDLLEAAKTSSDVVPISFNANSTLATDIVSISHNPLEATVTILFKETRRCLKPLFKGRLAGPYLAMITFDDWNENQRRNNNNNNNRLVGHYNVPVPGNYFIEIIALLCNTLSSNETMKEQCLENPTNHRITSDGSSVSITRVHQSYDATLGLGSWAYSSHAHSDDQEAQDKTQEQVVQQQPPLYTRYQPQNCRYEHASEPRCAKASDLARFQPYRFMWNKKTTEAIFSTAQLDGQGTTICIIGWSHTRVLIQHLNPPNGTTIVWQKAHSAADVKGDFVSNLFVQNCTKILLGVGQWDASKPTQFATYRSEVARVIQEVKEINNKRSEDQGRAQFYIWNVHYNPIGDEIGACPFKDGRMPPIVDRYNSINEELCNEYDVPFVDTRVVMSPVWDRASDWCHYRDESSVREGQFIMAKLFGLF